MRVVVEVNEEVEVWRVEGCLDRKEVEVEVWRVCEVNSNVACEGSRLIFFGLEARLRAGEQVVPALHGLPGTRHHAHSLSLPPELISPHRPQVLVLVHIGNESLILLWMPDLPLAHPHCACAKNKAEPFCICLHNNEKDP